MTGIVEETEPESTFKETAENFHKRKNSNGPGHLKRAPSSNSQASKSTFDVNIPDRDLDFSDESIDDDKK